MATAVLRQGEFVDQYKIDDPGNASGFDNNLFFIMHKIEEVVRQSSSVDHHTFKENFLCWYDPTTYPECPCDDNGQGGQESAGLCFLDSIMAAGGVTAGADLTNAAERAIYVAFWHEYRTQGQMETMLAEMTLEGLNDTQKKRGMKFAYLSQGVDITTANSIAAAWIDTGTLPVYNDYGLANVPLHDRRMLRILGPAGLFE